MKAAVHWLLIVTTLASVVTSDSSEVEGGMQLARRPLLQILQTANKVQQRKLLQATGSALCKQKAQEANVLARNQWLLKFLPFHDPDKCPEVCKKGATVPPAGNYNVTCFSEKCGCLLSLTNKSGNRITHAFSINHLGQFNDQSTLGFGCPMKYYETNTDCLGGQVWCKVDQC